MPSIKILTVAREAFDKAKLVQNGIQQAKRNQIEQNKDVSEKTDKSQQARQAQNAIKDLEVAKANQALAMKQRDLAIAGMVVGLLASAVNLVQSSISFGASLNESLKPTETGDTSGTNGSTQDKLKQWAFTLNKLEKLVSQVMQTLGSNYNISSGKNYNSANDVKDSDLAGANPIQTINEGIQKNKNQDYRDFFSDMGKAGKDILKKTIDFGKSLFKGVMNLGQLPINLVKGLFKFAVNLPHIAWNACKSLVEGIKNLPNNISKLWDNTNAFFNISGSSLTIDKVKGDSDLKFAVASNSQIRNLVADYKAGKISQEELKKGLEAAGFKVDIQNGQISSIKFGLDRIGNVSINGDLKKAIIANPELAKAVMSGDTKAIAEQLEKSGFKVESQENGNIASVEKSSKGASWGQIALAIGIMAGVAALSVFLAPLAVAGLASIMGAGALGGAVLGSIGAAAGMSLAIAGGIAAAGMLWTKAKMSSQETGEERDSLDKSIANAKSSTELMGILQEAQLNGTLTKEHLLAAQVKYNELINTNPNNEDITNDLMILRRNGIDLGNTLLITAAGKAGKINEAFLNSLGINKDNVDLLTLAVLNNAGFDGYGKVDFSKMDNKTLQDIIKSANPVELLILGQNPAFSEIIKNNNELKNSFYAAIDNLIEQGNFTVAKFFAKEITEGSFNVFGDSEQQALLKKIINKANSVDDLKSLFGINEFTNLVNKDPQKGYFSSLDTSLQDEINKKLHDIIEKDPSQANKMAELLGEEHAEIWKSIIANDHRGNLGNSLISKIIENIDYNQLFNMDATKINKIFSNLNSIFSNLNWLYFFDKGALKDSLSEYLDNADYTQSKIILNLIDDNILSKDLKSKAISRANETFDLSKLTDGVNDEQDMQEYNALQKRTNDIDWGTGFNNWLEDKSVSAYDKTLKLLQESDPANREKLIEKDGLIDKLEKEGILTKEQAIYLRQEGLRLNNITMSEKELELFNNIKNSSSTKQISEYLKEAKKFGLLTNNILNIANFKLNDLNTDNININDLIDLRNQGINISLDTIFAVNSKLGDNKLSNQEILFNLGISKSKPSLTVEDINIDKLSLQDIIALKKNGIISSNDANILINNKLNKDMINQAIEKRDLSSLFAIMTDINLVRYLNSNKELKDKFNETLSRALAQSDEYDVILAARNNRNITNYLINNNLLSTFKEKVYEAISSENYETYSKDSTLINFNSVLKSDKNEMLDNLIKSSTLKDLELLANDSKFLKLVQEDPSLKNSFYKALSKIVENGDFNIANYIAKNINIFNNVIKNDNNWLFGDSDQAALIKSIINKVNSIEDIKNLLSNEHFKNLITKNQGIANLFSKDLFTVINDKISDLISKASNVTQTEELMKQLNEFENSLSKEDIEKFGKNINGLKTSILSREIEVAANMQELLETYKKVNSPELIAKIRDRGIQLAQDLSELDKLVENGLISDQSSMDIKVKFTDKANKLLAQINNFDTAVAAYEKFKAWADKNLLWGISVGPKGNLYYYKRNNELLNKTANAVVANMTLEDIMQNKYNNIIKNHNTVQNKFEELIKRTPIDKLETLFSKDEFKALLKDSKYRDIVLNRINEFQNSENLATKIKGIELLTKNRDILSLSDSDIFNIIYKGTNNNRLIKELFKKDIKNLTTDELKYLKLLDDIGYLKSDKLLSYRMVSTGKGARRKVDDSLRKEAIATMDNLKNYFTKKTNLDLDDIRLLQRFKDAGFDISAVTKRALTYAQNTLNNSTSSSAAVNIYNNLNSIKDVIGQEGIAILENAKKAAVDRIKAELKDNNRTLEAQMHTLENFNNLHDAEQLIQEDKELGDLVGKKALELNQMILDNQKGGDWLAYASYFMAGLTPGLGVFIEQYQKYREACEKLEKANKEVAAAAERAAAMAIWAGINLTEGMEDMTQQTNSDSRNNSNVSSINNSNRSLNGLTNRYNTNKVDKNNKSQTQDTSNTANSNTALKQQLMNTGDLSPAQMLIALGLDKFQKGLLDAMLSNLEQEINKASKGVEELGNREAA